MSPNAEHGIKRRAPAPELETKFIPVDNIQQAAMGEGPPVSCNIARPLDRGGLLNGTDLPDEDEDGSRMSQLISLKRRRLEDGTAQIVRHEQGRKNILARYHASYRLTRHGSGIFTLNKQKRKNSGKFSEVRTQATFVWADRGY